MKELTEKDSCSEHHYYPKSMMKERLHIGYTRQINQYSIKTPDSGQN